MTNHLKDYAFLMNRKAKRDAEIATAKERHKKELEAIEDIYRTGIYMPLDERIEEERKILADILYSAKVNKMQDDFGHVQIVTTKRWEFPDTPKMVDWLREHGLRNCVKEELRKREIQTAITNGHLNNLPIELMVEVIDETIRVDLKELPIVE